MILKKNLFLTFIFWSLHTQASDVSTLVHQSFENLQNLNGHTFLAPGPNCFAAALYGVGGVSKFRAVSANEFSQFIQNSCVEVDNPRYGDIGYYYVRGFGPSHAFFYLDQTYAFEKPGVDYLGATSLRVKRISDIHYIRIATPECRRWGNEECHSQFKYVRCQNKPDSSTDFKHLLTAIEEAFGAKLNRNQSLTEETLNNLRKISKLAKSEYERAVVESLEKQLDFF